MKDPISIFDWIHPREVIPVKSWNSLTVNLFAEIFASLKLGKGSEMLRRNTIWCFENSWDSMKFYKENLYL